jgi:hypothetical protein
MGLVARTVIAVAIIYAISPDPTPEPTRAGHPAGGARDLARSATDRAAQAAADLCRRDKEGCIAFGLQTLAKGTDPAGGANQEPPAAATTASLGAARPATTQPAAHGRTARP